MAQVQTFDHADGFARRDMSAVYREGMIAGVLGAFAIALWFLAIDAIQGRPFYTPTVLGMALFRKGAGLEAPNAIAPSFDMVLFFTWVHFLIFALIGGATARLLAVAERQPNFGFGVVLLFVIFECLFVAAATGVESRLLVTLGWPAIAAGNLLAAVVIAAYFQRRHRSMTIRP